MSERVARVARTVAFATLALFATPARAQTARTDEARPLTVRDVVVAVLGQNATVQAALSECKGAGFYAEGEAARYPLTLQLDASLTNARTPQLQPGAQPGAGTVAVGTQDDFDGGLQLKKHLVWGTDLTFRLDATRTQSQQFVSFAQLRPLSTALGVSADGLDDQMYVVGPGYGAAARLSARQPLLRGAGRDINEATFRTARAQLTTAELTGAQTTSEVLRDALRAYWESWYAGEALAIERRARKTAGTQRDDAADRARTGSLAPADVLTFETQVATRDEDVVNAEATRRQRDADLARLLGAATGGEIEPSPEGPTEPPELDGDLRREALGASPALHVLASQVVTAQVQASTAGDALRPRLDLEGYVQAQGMGYDDIPGGLDGFRRFNAVSTHVGLTFELPVDDTQHRAQRDQAEAAVETAVHRLDEGRQRVLADLESARQAEASARQRASLAARTGAIASQQADAERARYATGGSTAVQVLQAEDAVRAAELRLARARTDLVQAYLAIAHLTGRLLHEQARPGDLGECSAP